MHELRDYQQETLYHLLNSKLDRDMICLPTGAGKTFVFVSFAAIRASEDKKGVIVVNRRELLAQTRKQLYEQYGIVAAEITAGCKTIPDAQVYLAMVESLYRRKAIIEQLRQECSYLIVDEAHLGCHIKILDGWEQVIGFSATPFYDKKGEALADYYHNIFTPVQIDDLIQQGHLVDADSYMPKGCTLPDPSAWKMNSMGNDYDADAMGEELSKNEYIQAVCSVAKKHCTDKRTIIYNASIRHSKAVACNLAAHGLNAWHVDGETPTEEREMIINKLHTERDCIVCNVGVLTFGFDCPDVEIIMLNRLTKSLNLFIQMAGRGSRVGRTVQKEHFKLLDLHGNVLKHGKWEDFRDWESYFRQRGRMPDGEAPAKACPKCDYLMHTRIMECPECGYVFPPPEPAEKVDVPDLELQRIEKLKRNVSKIVERVQERGWKEYKALHIIKEKVYSKHSDKPLDEKIEIFQEQGRLWCEEMGKKWDGWHQKFCAKIMTEHVTERTANLKKV